MNWTLLDEVGEYKVYGRDVPGGCIVVVVSPSLAGGGGMTFIPGTTAAAIVAAWS